LTHRSMEIFLANHLAMVVKIQICSD